MNQLKDPSKARVAGNRDLIQTPEWVVAGPTTESFHILKTERGANECGPSGGPSAPEDFWYEPHVARCGYDNNGDPLPIRPNSLTGSR